MRIRLLKSAEKELTKLDGGARKRVAKALESLERESPPASIKQLRGDSGVYRLRAGDYRVLFVFEEGPRSILVVKIGHRRDVYRKHGLDKIKKGLQGRFQNE